MRPPRALWVPFELGRPFGVPDDAAFQHRVLKAALDLLEMESGPVLVDFDEEAPRSGIEQDEGWACPIALTPPSAPGPNGWLDLLGDESARLNPWYQLSVRNRGRTTVGASGLEISAIIQMISDLVRGTAAAEGLAPSANQLKLATEDLKAFYFEAALAQPERASGIDVQNWFWGETAAARSLFLLREALIDSEDADIRRFAGWLLVPQTQIHRIDQVTASEKPDP